MKKIIGFVVVAAFVFSLSGICFAEEKEEAIYEIKLPSPDVEMEATSFEVGSEVAVNAVRQNPVSVPDWWDMTIDLFGNMVTKALQTGNLNLAVTDGGVPGAYIAIYESSAVNFIWGLNREGMFVGIEAAKPLWFQENLTQEELKKVRPQILYNYEKSKIVLAISYDFR